MHIIQSLLLIIVVLQQYVVVDAVSATIFSGTTCGGVALTSIENVPNGVCYSFHGRGSSSTTPTSGRLTCTTETATSAWNAQMYGLLSADDYTCSSMNPLPVSGTGSQCVSLFGVYSARINCAPDPNAFKLVTAGGIEAAIDRTEPFNLKVAPVGNITAGHYLQVSYSYLGEITAAGAVVPDNTAVTPNVFHSIPLTDILIAANLDLYTDDTPDYAFVGYVGGVPQEYSTNVSAAGINLNFVSKSDFQIASYNVTLPGHTEPTQVCLRGSSAGVCTPFQVNVGTLKNAIGLYNWIYAGTATKFRITYNLQLIGLTGARVYFNGDTSKLPGSFTGQVTSITWTSTELPFSFTFTQTVQQMFNKGDNTFGTASITSGGTATNLYLNVDIPLASLAVPSGALGYWLYDPDFTVATAQASPSTPSSSSTGQGGGGNQASSATSSSIVSGVTILLACVSVMAARGLHL